MTEDRSTIKDEKSILISRELCVSYERQVLKDIDLELFPGETLVVLGESGCGKTTLLKALAGSLVLEKGEVLLQGTRIESIPRRERKVVYLDQETLLFDHLNVFDNIAFPLRTRKVSPDIVNRKTESLITAVGLSEHAKKKSWRLSGGQKQRVAFARAIQAEPTLLLLDEPFCSLDDRTRNGMQEIYRTLHRQFGFSAVFVTHDVREALAVGDRFALMSSGKLQFYQSTRDFIADENTGVKGEIAFWKRVNDGQNS